MKGRGLWMGREWMPFRDFIGFRKVRMRLYSHWVNSFFCVAWGLACDDVFVWNNKKKTVGKVPEKREIHKLGFLRFKISLRTYLFLFSGKNEEERNFMNDRVRWIDWVLCVNMWNGYSRVVELGCNVGFGSEKLIKEKLTEYLKNSLSSAFLMGAGSS